MRIPIAAIACLLLIGAWSRAAVAAARDVAFALVQQGTDRSAGTAGARANAEYLEKYLRQMTAGTPGAQVFRQSFLMTVPVAETCRVVALPQGEGGEGKALLVFPLLPMGGQPPSLGEVGKPKQLDVIYGRQGRLEDLRGKEVAGRVVALDVGGGEASAGWQRCASLGAAAVVFLGNEGSGTEDLLNKSTTVPLGIPRLYCDDPAGVMWFQEAGGEGAAEARRVSAELRVQWEEKRAENVICVLPGRGTAASGTAGGEWVNQWVVLQARYDGVSQVMSRSPGATQAMNAGVLMDLAEQIARAPFHCGVVLVWTSGDEWNYRGTRAFLDMLHRGLREPTRGVALLKERTAEANRRFAEASELLKSAGDIAERGLSIGSPDALTARMAIEEELLRKAAVIEEALQQSRLREGKSADIDLLKGQKQEFLSAGALVSSRNAGPSTAATPAEQVRIQEAAREVVMRWGTEVTRRRELADALGNWADMRAAMPGGGRDPLLFLSVALTAASDTPLNFGFLSRSFYSAGLDVSGAMATYSQAFRRYASTVAQPSRFLAESMENSYALEALLPTKVGFPSDAAIARGQPSAAAATLLDPNGFQDTPNDTMVHIKWTQVEAQEQTLRQMLLGNASNPGALTDPLFYGRAELPVLVSDQVLTVFERAIGETLPRLKAAGALVGGESEIYRHPLGPPLAGTRRTDWYLSHADGTVFFESVVRAQEAEMRLQAFEFDGAGRMTRALAANQSDTQGMVANFYPDAGRPKRAMLFNARRLDAYGLFDPRYLDTLEQIQLLDSRRLDEAQFSNIYARQGVAAVFMPGGEGAEGIRWQLLASRGNVNNRMILINADREHPTGQGFDTTDPGKLGPLAWRTAQDFFTLDQKRKSDLEKFGITNEIIRELQAASEKQFAAARDAEGARDYPAFLAAANGLWSLQSQEYQNLIDTSNGIIKGVIFLLLGVIPFSYFLERLIIGATNIYRQIVWFGVIFVLMTVGLWFHPAFRISSAPLMILLAFLILILSSTVVYILWGKFEEEIARIRGTGNEAGHVASFRRGAVLGAAVRLGLSNMRRRGTRTALTLATLVLLTFTLLCFTSVRETVQVSPQEIGYWMPGTGHGAAAPAAGILLRQRGWQDLPVETLELARGLALPPAGALGEPIVNAEMHSGPVAGRWWYASQHSEQPWLLPVRSAVVVSKPYYISGLIGMDAAEAEFLPAGGAFAPPQGDACWLPMKVQQTLNLQVGDEVMVLGHSLRIAGFFSPEAFGGLRQLTGDPLSPLDPGGQKLISTGSGVNANDQAFRPEATYRFLDPISVAIVPAWITQQLGGRLSSVMFRPATIAAHPDEAGGAAMEALATALARRSAFTVYASTGSKVLSINAAGAARPQDLGTVLVPMLIAGVIVLNTMLGAVSERTREIHVYTSVGLSPGHVGMLFLAEAGALGTLGVVFGYIFGQGLATVLSATHWLPGVDLNYSSMSAIITMGLVLGIVMLSALWPARAASRLATPSLQRDWKLPRPVGDLLAVDLPFTVNEAAAQGVLAFLAEYLVSTSNSGTGRFTADNLEGTAQPTTQGMLRTLSARIWLAPYDLGVIQTMSLSIHPTDQATVFDVHVQLLREAGNPSTWQRLNRPFLTEIRKQFLLWRALETSRVHVYVERAQAIFNANDGKSAG